jgi:2'-5' RNA ligase
MSFFLAVDLDEQVREEVWAAASLHHAVAAKWLRRDKLHLTLVFLGSPTDEVRAGLEAQVRAVAAPVAPFYLKLRGAGSFETARAPAVLWLGVEGDLAALGALQGALSQALQADLERPYVPHLTLARSKKPEAVAALVTTLADFRSSQWLVSHLTFYESTESTYTPRWRVPLAGRTVASQSTSRCLA